MLSIQVFPGVAHAAGLRALPDNLARLHLLGTLVTNNCALASLPDLPRGLVTLNAQHNQLTTLPPSLGRCTALATCDLSHNRLSTFPPELGASKVTCRLSAVASSGSV
jgi:Leucine-rich repeat (LRR) protein